MGTFVDIANKRFGRLLVLRRDFSKQRTAWICKCDCGKIKAVRSNHLMDGATKSCGCIHRERASARSGKLHKANTKTGLSTSSTYGIWCGMKQRCFNPKSPFFQHYGGRGIKVCERWLDSFENFLVDMGQKPHGMTIDRIDNDGSYEPSNCRWVSRKQQQNNRRVNRFYIVYGKKMTLSQISEVFGIHRNTLDKRISKGIPIEQAIIPPSK